MLRTEKIGEQSFIPIKMGFKEKIKAYGALLLEARLLRYLYPWGPPYDNAVKECKLKLFYGEEAADAFFEQNNLSRVQSTSFKETAAH